MNEMIRRTATALMVALLVFVVVNAAGAATLSPRLQLKLNQVTPATNVGMVIVPFRSLPGRENLPDTDLNVGHGTPCAGIVGGNGQDSGGRYAGVAPGARLIGTG